MEDIKNASYPQKRLEAVRLHFIEGYNYSEVGRAIGVKSDTVSSWVKKWKAKMKFDEDLRELKNLIENQTECNILTRAEINKRIRTIEERTLVINFNFFG